MVKNELLWDLEGLQTVETVGKISGLSKQSAINLLSNLKKEGYVTVSGGGKQPRLYKISMKKQRKRDVGMFDIINKYSPLMKIQSWYDHQVHGVYGPEEALVDAVQTKSFRVILASLRLFNHISNWKKLYDLAKKKGCWQQIGALYDLARIYYRVRRMPKNYLLNKRIEKWKSITQLSRQKNFPEIEKKWKVNIPFNNKDLEQAS